MADQYTEDLPEQSSSFGLLSNIKSSCSFDNQDIIFSNIGQPMVTKDALTTIESRPEIDPLDNSINIDDGGHHLDRNDSKNDSELSVISKPLDNIEQVWLPVDKSDISSLAAVKFAAKHQEYNYSNSIQENCKDTKELAANDDEDDFFHPDHDVEIDDPMPIDFSMKPKRHFSTEESEQGNTDEETGPEMVVEDSNRKWLEYLKPQIPNENLDTFSRNNNNLDKDLDVTDHQDLKEDEKPSSEFPYNNRFFNFFPFLSQKFQRNFPKQVTQAVPNSLNPALNFPASSFSTFPYGARHPTMDGINIFQGLDREALGHLGHFYNSYQLNFLQNLIQNHQLWMMARNGGWGYSRDVGSKVNKNLYNQNNMNDSCPRKSDYSSSKHKSTFNSDRYNKRSFFSRTSLADDQKSLPSDTTASKPAQKKNCSLKDRFSKSPAVFGHSALTDKNHNDVSITDVLTKNNGTASGFSTDEVSQTASSCLGDFICQLCSKKFENSFGLASHNCSKMVKIKYECPQCEKVFNCPANLASHRRWHRPKL